MQVKVLLLRGNRITLERGNLSGNEVRVGDLSLAMPGGATPYDFRVGIKRIPNVYIGNVERASIVNHDRKATNIPVSPDSDLTYEMTASFLRSLATANDIEAAERNAGKTPWLYIILGAMSGIGLAAIVLIAMQAV